MVAVERLTRLACEAVALDTNTADELLETESARSLSHALVAWRFSPNDVGRCSRMLTTRSGRSNKREIESAAHALQLP